MRFMMLQILFFSWISIIASSSLTAQTTLQPSVDDGHDDSRTHDHHDLVNVQASPECWHEAMQAMSLLERNGDIQHHHASLGTMVCASMSHHHKKLLALELTQCQMHDVGRDLFTDKDVCTRPIQSVEMLHTCLSHISDNAMHAYSIFFTHVHQVCSRLTQEHLMHASHVATHQLHVLLNQQSKAWQEREESLQSQHEQFLRSLYNQSQDYKRQLMEWTQRTAMESSLFMKLESIMSITKNIMTCFTSVVYFLCMVIGIWIVTSIPSWKRHIWSRKYMLRLAVLELLVEIALHSMSEENDVNDTIGTLRKWILVTCAILYVVGWIRSFVCGTTPNNNETVHQVLQQQTEALRVLTTHTEKLVTEQEERKRVVEEEDTSATMTLPQQNGADLIATLTPPLPSVVPLHRDTLLELPPMYCMPPDSSHAARLPPPMTNHDQHRQQGNSPDDEASTNTAITVSPSVFADQVFYAAAYNHAMRVLSEQPQPPPFSGHWPAPHLPSAEPRDPRKRPHDDEHSCSEEDEPLKKRRRL